jgi:hypothetical protein
MATVHGKDGVVKIGATLLAEVTEFSVSETADTADSTAMGDEWKTHLVGQKSWSASVSCHWDKEDAGQEALAVGASVTLELYPGGDDSGAAKWAGTATVTGVEANASMSGIVSASFSATGNGALTKEEVEA